MATFAQALAIIIDWARDIIKNVVSEQTGSIGSSVQALLEILEMDCGGNWNLYIKTATQALGSSLYLLLTPSPQEIFESYLEPKPGRRGPRRGSRGDRNRRPTPRGRPRVFFGGGIPDIDNQIADALPGTSLIKGRAIGPGEHVFWTGINVADRILWYFLLIEATETFTTEWQSGLIESGECKTEGAGWARLATGNRATFEQPPMWFDAGALPVSSVNNMVIGNNGTITLKPPFTTANGWLITKGDFSVESDGSPGLSIRNVGLRVIQNPGSPDAETIVSDFQTLKIGPNQTRTVSLDGFTNFKGGHNWLAHVFFQPILSGPGLTVNGQFELNLNATSLTDE